MKEQFAALMVIARTKHIRKYLEENDPQALRQVDEAVKVKCLLLVKARKNGVSELVGGPATVWDNTLLGTLGEDKKRRGFHLPHTHNYGSTAHDATVKGKQYLKMFGLDEQEIEVRKVE